MKRTGTSALWGWVCVAALALAARAAGAHPELFVLERSALARGEFWRLWTGHLVHGSPAHYAYDVGAASALILVFGGARRLVWMLPLISGLLIGALPGVSHYYGLSACLHGWVVAAAMGELRAARGPRRWLAGAIVLAVLAKASLEAWTGASLFTAGEDFGGPVLHVSHLVGAAVGLLPAVVEHTGASRGDSHLGAIRGSAASVADHEFERV